MIGWTVVDIIRNEYVRGIIGETSIGRDNRQDEKK
jgi:hypothetical protein